MQKLKKLVDGSSVQYWNLVSRQRASPARNGVALGIGGNFGVSPTSVAVSIQVTNAHMKTGHTALHKGMGWAVNVILLHFSFFNIETVFPLINSTECDENPG